MILEFTVTVEAELESVSYIKHVILGALRGIGRARILFVGEGRKDWFENVEKDAIERGELEI